MIKTSQSNRVKKIEAQWHTSLPALFYRWHWKQNLRHSEIAEKLDIPRATITRWFQVFGVPSQVGHRFTNANLLNVGIRKSVPAKPKIKKEFPWRFNKEFFKEWSDDMAYVLGFLFADGYVQKNSRGSSYFCFVSADREVILKIRNLLGSNHAIGERIKSKYNPRWKNSYVLQIGSVAIFEDLKKFGIIQNKSLVVQFPVIPRRYLGHFVRGYFDGDGGVYFGKYWRKDRKRWEWQFSTSFTSGSKKFLIGLHEALVPYMRGGNVSKKDGGYELVFSKHDSLALFDLMYNNAEVFLERKYRTFQRAFINFNVAGVA